MTFVLRMVARELRAAWRRLLFFFVCVAVGVAAIVTVRSIIQSVRVGLMREARATIASDVIVQTSRPWTPEIRADLEAQFAAAPVLARSESIETATMVRPETGTAVARMVELRGVEAEFPYYGALTLQGGAPFTHDLLRGFGVLVRPDLLVQLRVAVGDRVLIGGHPFTIRGVIEREPGGRVGGFSLGSRVIVDLADLQATGLLGFGSRANRQILLRVSDEGVESLTRAIRDAFRDRFVNARSYKSTEDQIGENLERSENFLSLVGFVIVVLGGIGVWSVTRVFVQQKIRSVAILKCVGASSRQVLSVYVLQVALLAFAGSLLGVVLAAAAIQAIPPSLAEAFGGVPYGMTASAVLQGLAVGLLVSLLFALVPLLDVRRVKPLLLLRGLESTVPPARDPNAAFAARSVRAMRAWVSALDWPKVWTTLGVGGGLVAMAAWQAASWRTGAVVSLGFAGVTLVLYAAGYLLVRATAPIRFAPWFPLRHAVMSLRRPGNQTRVILLAVGLGSFFVLGVRAVQTNLIAEVSSGFGPAGADMFLIDVQRDQAESVRAIVATRQDGGSPPTRLVPVLRARVTAVRGTDVNLENLSDVRGRGSLAREYTVTYRDHLEENEQITAGSFWKGEPPLASDAAEIDVSIEEGMHERFNIGLGDRIRFDILGRTVSARVTSIRHVEWGDSRGGGFVFVFRPGPLDSAPHTLVGFVKGPSDATARARLQYDVVSRFPNISVIDGRDVLTRIRTIVDNAVLAISVVGGLALFSGVLILVGAVAMTKFQRVYESAILRTLGASTRTLTAMLALEYSTLGLLAGLIGAAGAFGLSWAVTKYVFAIPWRPVPVTLMVGAILTMVLVATVGVLASLEVLRKKPLSTLRAE